MSRHEIVSSSAVTHFAGSWNEKERFLVAEATRLLERDQPHDSLISQRGYPWVCTKTEGGTRTFYMAHWVRRPEKVFHATSARGLIAQIFSTCHTVRGFSYAYAAAGGQQALAGDVYGTQRPIACQACGG